MNPKMMSKALHARKGHGVDVHIMIGGHDEGKDEQKKLGLAPDAPSHPNQDLNAGDPMGKDGMSMPLHDSAGNDDDEAQDKMLIDEEMKKYGLMERGLRGKMSPK